MAKDLENNKQGEGERDPLDDFLSEQSLDNQQNNVSQIKLNNVDTQQQDEKQQKEQVKLDIVEDKNNKKDQKNLKNEEKEKTTDKKDNKQIAIGKDGKKQRHCIYRFFRCFKKGLTLVFANPVMIIISALALFGLCFLGQYSDWAYLNNPWKSKAYKGMAVTFQTINIVSVLVANLFWVGKLVKGYVGFFLILFAKILQWGETHAQNREDQFYINVISYTNGEKEEEVQQKSGTLYRLLSYIAVIAIGVAFVYLSIIAAFFFIILPQIFRFPALIYMYRKNRHDSGMCELIIMVLTWTCMTQLLQSGSMAFFMLQNNEDLDIWKLEQFATVQGYKVDADFAKVSNETGYIYSSSLAGLLLLIIPLQIYLWGGKVRESNINSMVNEILNKGPKFKFYFGCSVNQAKNYIGGTNIPESDGKNGKGIYVHRQAIFAEKDIRDKKAKKNEAIIELLIDLGKTLKLDKKDHPLMQNWKNSGCDSAYVPRGVLDPLLENYTIKSSSQIKGVLNAKKYVKDFKDNEAIQKLIPDKSREKEIKYVHPFMEQKIKKAREHNTNRAYEIAILKYLSKNAVVKNQ